MLSRLAMKWSKAGAVIYKPTSDGTECRFTWEEMEKIVFSENLDFLGGKELSLGNILIRAEGGK